MGSELRYYSSSRPTLHPQPACDCPKLVAHSTDPATWRWAVRNSSELAAYVAGLGHEAVEKLVVFYLDEALNLLSIELYSDDDPGAATVPIGRILSRAHLLGCKGLILVHNHPGGHARPSRADIAVTRRLCEGANAMDITLIEHVICAGVEMRAMDYL